MQQGRCVNELGNLGQSPLRREDRCVIREGIAGLARGICEWRGYLVRVIVIEYPWRGDGSVNRSSAQALRIMSGLLRGGGGSSLHEQDKQRPYMLAFALCVVFCNSI